MALAGASSVTEGSPYALTLGQVSDPNPLHVVKQYTVNWGDGSSDITDDRSLNGYLNHTLQHAYTTAGVHQISVDLTEQSVFPDLSFGGGTVTDPNLPNPTPGNIGLGWDSEGSGVAVDLTTGGFVQLAINSSGYHLVRYNADGTLDTAFGNGTGQVSLSGLNWLGRIAIDASGRILIPGLGFSVGRFNADGSPDTTFGSNGVLTLNLGVNSSPNPTRFDGIALDSQGDILLTGESWNSSTNSDGNGVLVRLTPSGALDTSFGGGTGMVSTIFPRANNVAVDPTTGDIVVFSKDYVNNQYLERYHSDETLDTTFGNGTGWVSTTSTPGIAGNTIVDGSMAIDSSGRIVMGGATGIYFGIPVVVRYNQDDTLDQSFGYNAGIDGIEQLSMDAEYGLALDSQGRIVVSGVLGGNAGLERLDVVTPDGPYVGVGTQTVTVQDVPATVTITETPQLPTDANNNATAPVGTLLTFGGSFSDNPAESRALSNTDVNSWSVTLNGQPYSLPASTVTNGPSISFTPTAVGNYVVSLTVTDPDGGTATAQQALDITSMDANSLQNVVNAEANYANPYFYFSGSKPVPTTVTIQADPTQINAAVAALNSLVQPQVVDNNYNIVPLYVPVDVTVTLNLTSGNYSDLNFSLQPPVFDGADTGFTYYITVVVNGVNGSTTVVGNSPALTVTSGNVTVNNVTFTTATNSTTILVAGGSLALNNDAISQTSTTSIEPAISVTAGTVNLGTATSSGNNTLSVNSSGDLVSNTSGNAISVLGDTFVVGGAIDTASNLSYTNLTSSAASSILHQAVTLTASVQANGSSIAPTGNVDFFDTTTNSDLGSVSLSGGVAQLTTSTLAPGNQVIVAKYSGDANFLRSANTFTESVHYNFGGFLPPLSNGLTYAVNRTIPIKFQLTDANSKAITSLSAVSSLQIAPVVNDVPGTPFNPASTNKQGVQYSGGQYQFNWQTKGLNAGSYQIMLTLADGTMQTRTIQLTAGGSSAGLVTDGSSGTATAGALLGGEVDLYVDNSNSDLTSDELARIQDAVTSIDATIAPYGVVINEVSDPTQSNVTLNMNTTSALGGLSQGVLGCTTNADQVTMIQGWNWYAGADPTQVGSAQYDFETAVLHELGHVLGLGHSSNSTSVMYATLAAGTANRTLVTADLNVPDSDSGPCALHAATVAVSDTSNGPGMNAPSSTSVPSITSRASSGNPMSAADQLFANFTLVLNDMRNAYQRELSAVTAMWQSADAVEMQRLDALLSMEAGAMGMSKDTLMRDLLFAHPSAPNGV
jgi:uncharacterized delta-60 repeat protein